MCNSFSKNSNYEPELFPALHYRPFGNRIETKKKKNAVCLVFSTGKIIITGAESCIEINDIFDNLTPILIQFREI
jgi:transcription initiation factor TFIID TATA-box-binding protein